jgi:signal transduction histidine kinase/ActR/RegA family two-component response regulator
LELVTNNFYPEGNNDPRNLQRLWENEFEAKSLLGHRMFCFAFAIGYPLTSVLYYLNGNPDYKSILMIQLACSAAVGLIIFFHFKKKINGQDATFYSRLLLLVVHSFILASFQTKYFYDLNINLTLQLIFSVFVLRWKLSYSLISSVATILFFSVALYIHGADTFARFIREGGMFYFLGQSFFPLILKMHYEKQYREFIYFHNLEKQNRELEKQNRLVSEATQAKSDFLSMMSHEIRTPLNGIVGIIHLMLQEDLRTDFQRELLGTLKFSSDHLMAVVNDVLDFNKINSKHVKLAQDPFDLFLLLKNLENTFIPRVQEKKLDLIVEIDATLPASLKGDQVRLNQIITNLVHNAVKFTETGFVKLTVKEQKRGEGTIVLDFEVRDSGIGIALEEQSAIFEIFMQGSNEASRANRGTGLGLAITKELVTLFGSDIHLDSKPGEGSCFSFSIEFPFSEEVIIAERPAFAKVSLPDARILIVDDNEINLLLATHLLNKVGLQYDTAANGGEALEKFGKTHYDMVLMDLTMPVMNGFEATRIIRSRGSKLPIIALTASAFTDEREKALASGFSAYLVKPFLPDEFYDVIFTFLMMEETVVSKTIEG